MSNALAERLGEIDRWALEAGLRSVAVIRLADANPAVANFDDEANAARIEEALTAVEGLDNTILQLDRRHAFSYQSVL